MDLNSSPYHQSDILDALTDLIAALDLELRIQWANRAAGEAVGEDPKNLLGRYCYQVWHGRDNPCEQCPVQSTIQTGMQQKGEVESPDGKVFLVKSYPLWTPEGELKGITEVTSDITEYRKAEEALQQKSRELKERVKELDCLYGLSRLMEQPGISRQELMQSAVELIPPAWQYPDMTCARLLLDGEAFYSPGFRETGWKQSADIVGSGKNGGRIEVFYLREAPECFEGPFLREERELIESIAERLGQYMEREQTKETLRRSEHYYRTIFETSGSAMFIIEEDMTISHVNSYFETLTGYSREEVEGRKLWPEFVHSDDVTWMREQHYLRRQDPAAAAHEYEFRFINRNEEVRQAFLTIDMIPGTQQSVISLIDITESKKAEEALRRSENYYRAIFESSGTAMFIGNEDTTIALINSYFEDLSGYARQEIEGKKSWTEFMHPEDVPWMKEYHHLRRRDPEAAPRHYECRFINRHGQKRDLLLSVDMIPETSQSIASGVDLTERKRAEERVHSLAYFDKLTGLPNRELFLELLRQAVPRSKRFEDCGAVLLVNIERLKSVNDTLGEQAGNELVREVGRRIQETLREKDTVARVSGDEFMILAEGIDGGQNARRLGLRILERIRGELELSHRRIYPEASIGLTLFLHGGTDPHSLIKQANLALSGAKKSASKIQQFAGDEEGISREFHLEQDLKSALANEEFRLFYQPQIDLQSGKIVGLEALIRWSHPQRGLVSPGEFIPLLERRGMITSVDAWVVRRVCEQLRSWRDEGFMLRASVNLSARDLVNDSIIGVVSSALEENRLSADALGVELTETGLMENVDRASGVLRTLSGWGIRVALDDFGKGYSCLSYLQRLDIQVIKIDKEFVAGMLENADTLTLVQTIIAMAHSMGKEVLAEGVEQREQWQKLLELGCDYGQGFLWGRPQQPEELKVQEE